MMKDAATRAFSIFRGFSRLCAANPGSYKSGGRAPLRGLL